MLDDPPETSTTRPMSLKSARPERVDSASPSPFCSSNGLRLKLSTMPHLSLPVFGAGIGKEDKQIRNAARGRGLFAAEDHPCELSESHRAQIGNENAWTHVTNTPPNYRHLP